MPKHFCGDEVSFMIEGTKVTGKVYIVDSNGTWENPGVISYDIMGMWNGKETLFKHIPEPDLI